MDNINGFEIVRFDKTKDMWMGSRPTSFSGGHIEYVVASQPRRDPHSGRWFWSSGFYTLDESLANKKWQGKV